MTGPSSGFSRRASPAFAAGGIGYEPDPSKPGWGVTIAPYGGWACFHCGERFTHWLWAERHFGETPDTLPACLGAGEAVVEALRAANLASPGDWPEALGLAVRRVDWLRRQRLRHGEAAAVPPLFVPDAAWVAGAIEAKLEALAGDGWTMPPDLPHELALAAIAAVTPALGWKSI